MDVNVGVLNRKVAHFQLLSVAQKRRVSSVIAELNQSRVWESLFSFILTYFSPRLSIEQ